jgi:hypothetical protein
VDDDLIDQEELDVRYRELVDSFIDHANELSGHNSIENVGMAMLFAAARFNAYVVSQHADNKEAFKADLPRAREFFIQQYQEMLEENLEDYGAVYEKYAHLTRRQ